MTAPRALFLIMMTATAAVAAGVVDWSRETPDPAPLPLIVGETLPSKEVHVITEPGLYGLARNPDGSRYAVAGSHLIRIEADSAKIQSILRQQNEILD